jgi:hypothetical protein
MIEEIAKMTKSPYETFATVFNSEIISGEISRFLPPFETNDNILHVSLKSKGIITQVSKLKVNISKGDNKNILLFAFDGINICFDSNFNPSAKGCNRPHNPTTFGPRRL